MNKTAIKNFAVWARNKLIADISYRAGLMGITESGIASALPQSTGTTEFYDIGTAEPYAISGDAVRQRRRLVELIERKEKETDYKTAYKYIIEEVAYTWFNRLIAVRFMEVNDYLPSHIRVLSSESGKMEPDLVTTPFDANLEFTGDEEQQIFQLKNDNKLDELFRILFIKQCNALNEFLPVLFEKTNDYTELLFNLSFVDQDSVVRHLLNDIPEDDFNIELGGQVEIIGWLYQYYNTEPKDETFALLKKNVKITKERIPAATQLFTPDWIVRYMVENSLGRIWLQGHTNEGVKANWEYYLDDAFQCDTVLKELGNFKNKYNDLMPEDIKIIDPCMGSGHILVYAFDVLMEIYESAGYSQRDAAKSILENNIYGLDIDERAFQMAYFAVMMKARQYNRRILSGNTKYNLYVIPESNAININHLNYFGFGMEQSEYNEAQKMIRALLNEFVDAKEYGSLLSLDDYNWELLNNFVENIHVEEQLSMDTWGIDVTKKQLEGLIKVGKILSSEYHAVITNPPYMGASGMNSKLSSYVKSNYPNAKADTFACFIERAMKFAMKEGVIALITMESWMFLSSFEKLRKSIIENATIVNMVHMPYLGKGGTSLGINFGTAATVMFKQHINNYNAQYDYICYYDLDADGTPCQFPIICDRYVTATSELFSKIPGSPIAYWLSKSFVEAFERRSVGDDFIAKFGMSTGDGERFIRFWYETDFNRIEFDNKNEEDAKLSVKNWVPIDKGGAYRRWYGNQNCIVWWKNNGNDIRNHPKSAVRSPQYFFKPHVSWTLMTTGTFSARYFEHGFALDTASNCVYYKDDPTYEILAFLNSKVAAMMLQILNPTINFSCGVISLLPFGINDAEISKCTKENISIAKDEWDESELSWGFTKNPIVKKGLIKDAYLQYEEKCNSRIKTMQKNEEYINRRFVELFNLEDSVDWRVEIDEISISKPDLRKSVADLLSYAVGCMFGRYSLDQNGLICTAAEVELDKYQIFKPDVDNIIPITDEEYLEDDIISRLCVWLRKAYGEDLLEENLDFIANALGGKGASSREIIRNYFLKDFFLEHCKNYQKRPIYYMFDSGKQNGFKALIYLHRYNPDTIGNLRVDYLHRMQRVYESEVNRMQDTIDHSSNAREVTAATKRKEKLQKQIKECREYDEKISHLALSRIEIDLDDGVKVNYEKIQTASDGKKYQVLAKI